MFSCCFTLAIDIVRFIFIFNLSHFSRCLLITSYLNLQFHKAKGILHIFSCVYMPSMNLPYGVCASLVCYDIVCYLTLFIYLFVYLWLNFKFSLYILDTSSVSDFQIFFQVVIFLLILLKGSFHRAKHLNFNEVQLLGFFIHKLWFC